LAGPERPLSFPSAAVGLSAQRLTRDGWRHGAWRARRGEEAFPVQAGKEEATRPDTTSARHDDERLDKLLCLNLGGIVAPGGSTGN
jgi:hypothetical protein